MQEALFFRHTLRACTCGGRLPVVSRNAGRERARGGCNPGVVMKRTLPIVGTAGYFMSFTSLGLLGRALTGVMGGMWLIMLFKGIMDTKRVIEGLCLTIAKKLTADDKPNW